MFVTKKVRKRLIKLVFVFLLFFVCKSDGAENDVQVGDDDNQNDNTLVTTKERGPKAESGKNSVQDDDNTVDNTDKKSPTKEDDGKSDSCNSIYGDIKLPMDSNGSKQSSDDQNGKKSNVNQEENDKLSGSIQPKIDNTHVSCKMTQ